MWNRFALSRKKLKWINKIIIKLINISNIRTLLKIILFINVNVLKTSLVKLLQGFVHNAGGYFHNFTARPSLEEVTKYTNIYSHTFLMMVEKSIPLWEKTQADRKSAVAISSPGCNITNIILVARHMYHIFSQGLERYNFTNLMNNFWNSRCSNILNPQAGGMAVEQPYGFESFSREHFTANKIRNVSNVKFRFSSFNF